VRARHLDSRLRGNDMRERGNGLEVLGSGAGSCGNFVGVVGNDARKLGKHGEGSVSACVRWGGTALLVLALAACGAKDDKPVATQVAAKVGKEEISVHQINQVLSRSNTGATTPQSAEAMRRDVLEKLIDQQLAVDQAIDKKLHRSPEVVAQIEAARREVLARAYVQQLAAAMPKPSPEELKKYYDEHPQLFAERRVYNLQELLVPASAGPDAAQQLRAQIAAGKSMEDMANWLRERNIKFGGGAATRAAEQIPLELLARLHPMRDGQIAIFDNPQGFTVLRVAASQRVPVAEAAALPRIEQFLANQRGAEMVTKTIKDLRANTTITYMGDFAQAGGAVGSAAGAATPAPATAATPATAPSPAMAVTPATTPAAPPSPATAAAPVAPVAPATALDDKTRAAIEKGVSGLK